MNQVRGFLLFDIIIFAVKPQIAKRVLEKFVSLQFKKSAVFISIIAGKKINFFNQFLPLRNQFIRVMPNMPAIIDQGMSCMVSNRYVSRTNKNKIELLFSKVGLTLWLKKEIEINKVPVRALRINYMGELGWELHHPMKQMESLYDAIYEVGKKDSISNFGTYAVNSLRIEKAYRGWGAELTGEISLVEAGMDRFFNLNKKSNFIGSEALREKLQSGVDIKIVYLEIDVDDADARGNEPVYHNNKIVGVVTSGGYGFRVNKSLAFAYVESDLAEINKEFDIRIQGQKRRAIVLKDMAYDSENKRLTS